MIKVYKSQKLKNQLKSRLNKILHQINKKQIKN